MTQATLSRTYLSHKQSTIFSAALAVGFGASLLIRVIMGGHEVAQSKLAALIFAGCLTVLTMAVGTRLELSRRTLMIGIAGGLFLCLPAILMSDYSGHATKAYLSWAPVTVVVAFAEEAFLRGALFDVLWRFAGKPAAIVIPAIAFAALHVPLYGWRVVPLDLAVGLWLGVLRLTSGSFVAPGIAHAIADLVSWWL